MARKSKRGISTIIGGVFIVAIIILGVTVIIRGLELQSDLGQTIVEQSGLNDEKGKEDLKLWDVKIENEKFNMTLVNTGSLPVHMVRLWVTNTTDTNGWHQYYELDEIINPNESTYLGDTLPLVALNSSSYKIKIVTERGNSNIFQLLSPKDNAIEMSLIGTPRSLPTNQNLTLLFGVKNNFTEGSMVQIIEPIVSWTITEAPIGEETATVTLVEGPTPVTEESLILGETVFFEYLYTLTGDVDDLVTFNATITDAKIGNFVTETVYLTLDNFALESGSSVEAGILASQPGTIDPDTLFYHRGSVLDGYEIDHVIPITTSGVEHELNSTSTTVKFYTKNMTSDARFGDSGLPSYRFDHRWDYYTEPSGDSASVTILVEEVSLDGQTVIDTLDSYTTTWNGQGSCDEENFSDQSYSSNRNINAQNRLRITLTYNSGPANSVTLCFDSTNDDSRMRFRDDEGSEDVNTPFPSYPVTYSGGDIILQVTHLGPKGAWFALSTRVVFNDTASDTSYAGFLYEYSETDDSCPNNCDVDRNSDTRFVQVGESIKFIFREPNSRPLFQGGDGTPITSGSYRVFVHMRGYDENGQLYLQIADYGTLSY